MEKDPFEVLGIQHGAEPEVVSAAYKALSRKYHPDLNPNDTDAADKMKEINSAYADIKNGNYKDEAYYHPEKAQPQYRANEADNYYTTGSAANPDFRKIYINVDPYLNNNPPQEPNPNQKKGKGKTIWTYDGKEMPLWKALLHQAWDRWLSQLLLYVVVPIIILLIVFKAISGHSLGGEAKKSKDDIKKSLTANGAMIESNHFLPETINVNNTTYEVTF